MILKQTQSGLSLDIFHAYLSCVQIMWSFPWFCDVINLLNTQLSICTVSKI